MSPPDRAGTCDGEVQIASAAEYLLNNRIKTRNFIWGELNAQGVLVFWVENLPKDGKGCPGWWMFDQMMAQFGLRVMAIHGNWTYGNNLEAVNALTGVGIPLDVAATRGPTGRYAAAHGYTRVTVVSSSGVAGAYLDVQVRFEK